MERTVIKFLIVGDYGVGKTTLFRHFIDDAAYTRTEPTIAFDYAKKELDDAQYGRLLLHLWDMSGSDKYHGQALFQIYYKNARGILVVFDATQRRTFESVTQTWLPRIRSAHDLTDGYRLCLIANKVDLVEKREVDTEEARLVAQYYDMDYCELSSLHATHAEMRVPFLMLAVQLIDAHIVQPQLIDERRVVLVEPTQPAEEKWC